MSKLRSQMASLDRAAADLRAGGRQSVWDTRAPRDALMALGAVQEIREDAHGETRGGWWLDGVWLAPGSECGAALEAIGSEEALAALRELRATPRTPKRSR